MVYYDIFCGTYKFFFQEGILEIMFFFAQDSYNQTQLKQIKNNSNIHEQTY